MNVPDIPAHVAVIMDGNGRWAKQRTLPRQAGHRAGVKTARRIVEACARRGVGVLTLFAFSSENWRRPSREVGALMRLFVEALDRQVDELHGNGVRLMFIGDRSGLSDTLQARMTAAEETTRDNTRLTLVIALAYGGRWDIVAATRALAREVATGRLDPEAIDDAMFADRLALAGLPDPDLLIRTGGDHRISNFLLWNLAYAECWFTDRLWPDFDEQDLDKALDRFRGVERRYGRISEQLEDALEDDAC
ncbi:polyprenyl diphosphate synthase [Wenzhouxiangella sp. XN24]|uniref:polyprenyl diphosphate synthase n=1 Tax=Wenzhouxiangella sp. XN24 TaxID=2713569 RepID=UPI003211DB86